jgi:3-phenylpropionate/trans-cinnamate dioxygenase ferredoxin reductase subunit
MVDARSVVVVGAGLGGLKVCEELRRLGFDGRLTLLGAESGLPYDRPPLSKEVLKGARANPPVLREAGELDERGIALRPGSTAVGLDTVAQRVSLAGGATVDYDVLVIATGARPRPWGMAGTAGNVWELRTAADAARIAEAVRGRRRLAVLGAGFIGCEVTASAREMGCPVTLIEMLPTPMSRVVGIEVGAEIARRHAGAGADVRCAVTIVAVTTGASGEVTTIHLSDGGDVEIDALVVGLGVTPNVEWLGSSGLTVEDGIVCDARGGTSCPNVYAIGDVARWVNVLSGRHRRVEHWTTTIEHAAIVAREIAQGTHERRPLGEVPYFWSDQYGTKIQCVGEPSGSAEITSVVTGPSGDRPLFLYGRGGRLVGAVGFGLPGAVMRLRARIAEGTSVQDALRAVDELAPVTAVGRGRTGVKTPSPGLTVRSTG